MIEDIKICKSLQIKEIVTGIQTTDCQIDMERMKILIDVASPMKVVFHMAIDNCHNYHERIKRILTKGRKYRQALEGKDSIKQIVELFPELTILAGGGDYQRQLSGLGLILLFERSSWNQNCLNFFFRDVQYNINVSILNLIFKPHII